MGPDPHTKKKQGGAFSGRPFSWGHQGDSCGGNGLGRVLGRLGDADERQGAAGADDLGMGQDGGAGAGAQELGVQIGGGERGEFAPRAHGGQHGRGIGQRGQRLPRDDAAVAGQVIGQRHPQGAVGGVDAGDGQIQIADPWGERVGQDLLGFRRGQHHGLRLFPAG